MPFIEINPVVRPPQSGDGDWWAAAPLAGAAQDKPATAPAPSGPNYGDAIAKVESGGNYRAVGPATGDGDRALGKYQIMGKNIRPWSKEVLGEEVTPTQFMSSPEIQDKIFQAKFGSYVNKYGPEGASKAWFAGEKGMNNPNAKDVLGTTVSGYAQKFMGALGPRQAEAAPQAIQGEGARPVVTSAPLDDNSWWKDAPVAGEQPKEVVTEPTVGKGEAIARGAAQGASLNFYDELRGLMEAGGLNPKDPASLTALLSGAYKYWSGDKEAEQKYNAGADRERALTKEAETQRPIMSGVGNLAGAVALPIGGLVQAATLPGRIGKGVAVGAGLGAAYGAGEGKGLEDSLSRAGTGALIGGAVGGVAPPVIEGAGAAVGAVTRPIQNAIRGMRDPEAEAGRRVVEALRRDAANGQPGLSPTEMVAARSEGAPVANMDMGGETTRALGRSAANTSPEARAALEKTINDRFGSQAGRAEDAIRSLVRTPANAGLTQEALQKAADTSRAPFYNRAYRDGANGVWDQELEQLAKSPVMTAAMKEAVASIQNKASTGRAMQPMSQSGTPTLEFWDQVKRNLDSKYKMLSRQGDAEAAADVQAVKSALLDKLDTAVPSYATARGVAAELFKAGDALEAGQKFVTSTMKNAEFAKAIGRMTPEERTLFAEGFASKLIEKLNEGGQRRNIINEIQKSPAAKERVRLALGPNGAEKLDAFISREQIMDRWRGAITGNSTTVRQLVEAGLAGGAYGSISGNWDMSTLMAGAITFGARRGQVKIDQGVAKRVGEMLASSDPLVLQKGLNIVAGNAKLGAALRNAEEAMTKIGGQQSSPAMQLPAPSRAQDQQPEIPRPPGQ